jgi:hypothetical protein
MIMRLSRPLLVLMALLLLAGCNGRPLLYQLAPSETDLEALAAFQMIDAAGTGSLTRQQADDYFRRRFQDLDANRDGFLSPEEARGILPVLGMATGSNMVFRLDLNGDGRLSQDEFLRIADYLFLRDENRDGVLTLVEVKTPPVASYVPVGKKTPGFETTGTSGAQPR